jgi:hypothetical protein
MKFAILTYITPEHETGAFDLSDLKELEDFIKVNIAGRKYGSSVNRFEWGFDLFEFGGIFAGYFKEKVIKWQPSLKQVTSHSHFDWKKFARLSKINAVKLIRKECLDSIKRVDLLKRKPKDFKMELFHDEMKQVFDHYVKHNLE